jgi:hypothetical protein
MTSTSISLAPGDLLQIERRFVVDGVVTTQTDQGRFAGVQAVGSAEHLALECATRNAVRLFPLHAIVEITLVEAVRRETPAPAPSGPAAAAAWDPGVA